MYPDLMIGKAPRRVVRLETTATVLTLRLAKSHVAKIQKNASCDRAANQNQGI